MEVRTERAVSATPRVIDPSHWTIDSSVAATLGKEQVLTFGAVDAKLHAPALWIREHHSVERFETHSPSSAHLSTHLSLGMSFVSSRHARRSNRSMPSGRLPLG